MVDSNVILTVAVVPSEDGKFQGWFGKTSAAGEGSGQSAMGGQPVENSFGIQHCNIAIFWPDCILPCKMSRILHLQTHTEVLRQLDTKVWAYSFVTDRRGIIFLYNKEQSDMFDFG